MVNSCDPRLAQVSSLRYPPWIHPTVGYLQCTLMYRQVGSSNEPSRFVDWLNRERDTRNVDAVNTASRTLITAVIFSGGDQELVGFVLSFCDNIGPQELRIDFKPFTKNHGCTRRCQINRTKACFLSEWAGEARAVKARLHVH